jgi:CHAD domain-containing protein
MKKRVPFAGEFVSEALIDALDVRWKKFRKNLKTLCEGVTTRAVHDERTASRRLLSALGVVEPLVGRRLVRKVEGDLKRMLGALGPLRDVHIELARTRRLGGDPRVPPFRRYLEREERDLEKKALRRSRRLPAERMRGQVRRIKRRVRRLGRSGGGTTGPTLGLLRAIDQDFSRVLEMRRALDPANPESLHRLRIALKKYRYSVEALEPVLRGFGRSDLEELHELQTRLGDLHDLEMMSASFRDFLRKYERAPVPHLVPLQRRILDQHHEELRTALLTVDRILDFWQRWKGKGVSRLWVPSEAARPVRAGRAAQKTA